MLTAVRNNSDERHMAREMQRKEGPFFCPVCGEEVVLKKGKIKIHHFAHKAYTSCEYGTNESEEHRRCKTEIYDALSTYDFLHCSLEKPLAGIRPDILIKSDRKNLTYGIEVQISNLTMEQIIQRTKRYAKLGIFVLWLPLFNDLLTEDRYTPRQWEKWLHALNFGRVYYWQEGVRVAKVHFDDYTIWVESWEGYDGRGGGGYDKVSRRYKTPVIVNDNLSIVSSFRPTIRNEWSGGSIQIPPCRILLDGVE